jgi:hypothetical protein
MSNQTIVITVVIGVISVLVLSGTVVNAFAMNKTDCDGMHKDMLYMKQTYGNKTTVGYIKVHTTIWYEVFNIYNTNCADITGYLQP